jgi:alkyldihydroxyacetonephosphate synthase
MVDTKRLDRIGPLDEVSGLVTVEPGVIGQNLEEWLGARGWTLGHFPSSITVSSVGGFAAARSAGQSSTKYGKFESMVAGLTAVLPDGTVVVRRPQPASAAGPDLVGVLLGSEGTLGVITQLVVRVHPAPEAIALRGYRLPSFGAGLDAVRAVLRQGLRPAVVRLYDEADTSLFHPEVGEGCLLVTMCEGWPPLVALEEKALGLAVAAHGGSDLGEGPGRSWHERRYEASYKLADYLKPQGAFGDAVAVDTVEVAASWRGLPATYAGVRTALAEHMDLVLCHASHAYPDGACLYFTFGAAGAGDEEAVRARYEAAWSGAMTAAIETRATITHHHGVGLLRAPWLQAELGDGGFTMLSRIKDALDPAGVANPGKLGLAAGGAG